MGKQDEVSKKFLDALEFRGIKRRDFLKFCGATAALLGLSELQAPKIAAALKKQQRDSPLSGSILLRTPDAPSPLSKQLTRVLQNLSSIS